MSTGVEGNVHNRFSGDNATLTGCGFANPGAQALALAALAGPSYLCAQVNEATLQAGAGIVKGPDVHAIG